MACPVPASPPPVPEPGDTLRITWWLSPLGDVEMDADTMPPLPIQYALPGLPLGWLAMAPADSRAVVAGDQRWLCRFESESTVRRVWRAIPDPDLFAAVKGGVH